MSTNDVFFPDLNEKEQRTYSLMINKLNNNYNEISWTELAFVRGNKSIEEQIEQLEKLSLSAYRAMTLLKTALEIITGTIDKNDDPTITLYGLEQDDYIVE